MRKTRRILTLDEIEWIMTTDTSNEGCAKILGCTPGAIIQTRQLNTNKARWVAEYLGHEPTSPALRPYPKPSTPGEASRQRRSKPSIWQTVWNWLFGDWSRA